MEGGATSSGGTSRAAESMSTSKLFYDASSKEPLAFHLHSALPSKLKVELTHLIKTHGGKIHKRLIDLHRPFYALINPDSPQVPQYAKYVCSLPEGQRGTVVPYSFVRASITAREILLPVEFQPEHPIGHEGSSAPWAPLALTRGLHRQGPAVNQEQSGSSAGDGTIVDDDGWGGLEPVAVHLHSTIGQDDQRRLALKIAKAGGDPGSTIADARVVVADEDHAEFSRLRKQYEHSLRTYVEPVTWVARCLSKGRYFHDPIEKAPMSGRKPGADRNDFTTEDDNNLARFIAKRIPDKSEGGRTGNNLYKDLCERTDIYPWASAHTWQSWRNRYRKKQDYFDPIIDKYVQIRQDNGDSKVRLCSLIHPRVRCPQVLSFLSDPRVVRDFLFIIASYICGIFAPDSACVRQVASLPFYYPACVIFCRKSVTKCSMCNWDVTTISTCHDEHHLVPLSQICSAVSIFCMDAFAKWFIRRESFSTHGERSAKRLRILPLCVQVHLYRPTRNPPNVPRRPPERRDPGP
ncbi:hypothetical protein ACGC1H_004552 [Rhizoctonia solani]